MRALTIYQPWAWAIVHGHKSVENRRWRTHYRGRLIIHAAAGAGDQYDFDWCAGTGLVVPEPDELPYGALVGECELIDVLADGEHDRSDPWAEDWEGWKWLLRGAAPYRTPIPCRGSQGFWIPASEALKRAQLR